MKRPAGFVAVIGGGREEAPDVLERARRVGELLALSGVVVLCGGLGGVMEAAARGAFEAGGTTVGLLPDEQRGRENPFISVPVATGLGIGRNVIIARSADALIAVGGEYGTLSEIAFGLQLGRPVIGLGSWEIRGVVQARDPAEAVEKALGAIGHGAAGTGR